MLRSKLSGILLIPIFLYGKPIDPKVTSGTATFQTPSNTLLVVNSGDRTIIQWNSFSIHENEHVIFNQLSSHSSILNRVTSSEVSKIMGKLTSNGKVILINPFGVLFGEKASINTHAFIASTLDLLDADFLNGKDLLFKGESNAGIVNLGEIKARGGDITLIGRYITNEGTIKAPEGVATLAVGKEILLKPSGKNRVFISPNGEGDLEEGIIDKGTIEALRVQLIADGNAYKFAIKHEGKIDALSTQEYQGDIYLVSEGGSVESRGQLHASGGHVRILGENVALMDHAFINTSSADKGGTVLIGGAFQGNDPDIYNARQTIIGENVKIQTSALENGNAGDVVVWADGTTIFHGNIEAKGGVIGGNGGFVEVSGKTALDWKGSADRTAPFGIPGTLLLDPSDVTIVDSSGSTTAMTLGPTISPAVPFTGCQLRNEDLTNQLTFGPVVVTTSSANTENGDLIIKADIDDSLATPYNTSNSLTLISNRDLVIYGSVQNEGSGAIICSVGRDLVVDGSNAVGSGSRLGSRYGDVIITTGGSVLMSGGGGVGRSAQIGYIANEIKSNISLDIGGNLYMQCVNNYALIGHTYFGDIFPPLNFTGDINISRIGGELVMIAGGDSNAFAQIGLVPHQSSGPTSMGTTGIGNITISNVGSNIQLTGGQKAINCYTLIGHGGRPRSFPDSFQGDILVRGFRDLVITGGRGGNVDNFAGIGYGQTFPVTGGTHTFTSNFIDVGVSGRLILQAGQEGTGNHAYIGAYTGSATTVGPSFVNLSIGRISTSSGSNTALLGDGNNNADSDAIIGLLGRIGPAATNVNVTSGDALFLIAGTPPAGTSDAAIRNAIRATGGSINVTVSNGSALLRGSNLLGGGTADITSAGTLDVNVQNGNLNITSRNDSAFITTFGVGNVFASRDIVITGNPLVPVQAYIKGGSYLRVQAGDTIDLVENSLITTSPGILEVIAGNDINMSALSQIINGGAGGNDLLNIVVDNDFPTSPGIGFGALNMEPGATIFGDEVRIFTARQNLNNILGLINGTPFTPGPLYADQAPEKWLTYYFDSFFHTGSPFTIFYKDGVVSVANVQRSQVLISEALTDLHPYDEFLGWSLEFQEGYDVEKYNSKHLDGISSFQIIPDQMYYLRMRKHFNSMLRDSDFILFPTPLKTTTQQNDL